MEFSSASPSEATSKGAEYELEVLSLLVNDEPTTPPTVPAMSATMVTSAKLFLLMLARVDDVAPLEALAIAVKTGGGGGSGDCCCTGVHTGSATGMFSGFH